MLLLIIINCFFLSDNPYDPELIVRRGEEFDITIYLDRPYDLDKHNIKLVFKSGEGIRNKEMFYLTTHSTHLVGHMVKDHS